MVTWEERQVACRKPVRLGSAVSSGLASAWAGTQGEHTTESLSHWPELKRGKEQNAKKWAWLQQAAFRKHREYTSSCAYSFNPTTRIHTDTHGLHNTGVSLFSLCSIQSYLIAYFLRHHGGTAQNSAVFACVLVCLHVRMHAGLCT